MSNLKSRKQRFFIVASLLAVGISVVMLTGCSRQGGEPDKSIQASSCANQLKMLANAKHLWAEQNNKTANDTPTAEELRVFVRGSVTCPYGGTYTMGKVGEEPSCSIAEHQAAFVALMKQQQEQPAPAQ